MNIVINAVLFHEQPRGVGRYFNTLLPELAKIDKDNQYFVIYAKWMSKYTFLDVKQENIHFICIDIPHNKILRNLYLALVLPLNIKKFKPDVYHQIDTSPIFFKTCRLVSTIHDLAEFEVPEKYSKFQAVSRRIYVKKQIKLSDIIITDSNYSKNDMIHRFQIPENKISVIYISLGSQFKYNANKELPEKYFIYVGEIERSKNLSCIIEAFSKLQPVLRKVYKICVIGKQGNDYENVLKKINEHNLSDKVKFFGYVSDDELLSIYKKAYAFIFPSFFEGFGLPVLEAMGTGVPVICSNASSIPEIGGDAVLTFHPSNSEELKEKMEYLINNENVRSQMIEKGIIRAKLFSSQEMAQKTLAVYKEYEKRNNCGREETR